MGTVVVLPARATPYQYSTVTMRGGVFLAWIWDFTVLSPRREMYGVFITLRMLRPPRACTGCQCALPRPNASLIAALVSTSSVII